MIISCPDIAFATGALSQFLSNPNKEHYQAAIHSLRNIRRTIDYGFTYRGDTVDDFRGYSDTLYIIYPNTRKSVSSYIFFLAGTLIS